MINRIVIELPLPVKVGVFFFNRKRKVGFSFDNLAKFNFSQEQGINTPDELKEWVKKHGENTYMVQQLYAAHLSYNMHERIEEDVDKNKFMVAIANVGEEVISKIVEVWKRSESFGAKEVPSKKKARAKH